MNKLICLPLIVFLFLTIFPLSVYASSMTLDSSYDVGDAMILQAHPTWNHYTRSYVQVSTGLYGGEVRSYVMFNLTPVPDSIANNITNATLRLYYYALATATTSYANISNTTNNWTEVNVSWTNKPVTLALQESKNINWATVNVWHEYNVTNAVISAITGDDKAGFVIQLFNSTVNGGGAYYSKEASSYKPELIIQYGGTTECNLEHTGSFCDSNDLDNRGIITYYDLLCDNTSYYICPVGTTCEQTSPVINITTSPIEDLTDCSRCWFINTWVDILHPRLINLATNCPYNPECNCNNYYCSGGIYETNLTDTPYNITEWSAGCYDYVNHYVPIIINSTGNSTTVDGLIKESGCSDCNLTSPPKFVNTSTTCYNSAGNVVPCSVSGGTPTTSSWLGLSALWVSSYLFGITDFSISMNILSIMLSFIVSIIIVVVLSVYADIGGKFLGSIFLGSILFLLVMFTLAGMFPTWLIVILIVISALGMGGVLGGLVGG